MKRFCVSGWLLAGGLALAAPVGAQTTPRPAQSVGVAAGVATQPPAASRDPQAGRWRSALLVGLAPRRLPVEVRGELAWAHWSSYAGPVSLSGNVVLPVGALALGAAEGGARLRPYAIAGLGGYGIGSTSPRDAHWNAGAGLRLEALRWAVYMEGRRLAAYRRTVAAGGVTVGL